MSRPNYVFLPSLELAPLTLLSLSRSLLGPAPLSPGGAGFASTASAASPSPAQVLGKTLFRGNVTYVSYIVAGCVVAEAIYGTVLDGFWNTINRGRTYASTDWSKFKTDDE